MGSGRVIAYVDGYNLYFGLKAKGRRYLWLDLKAPMYRYLLENQSLVQVKYFTSRIQSPRESVLRQSRYIDVLRESGVAIIEGRHGGDPLRCECGRTISMPGEKMTDVNIALEVARDSFKGDFDTAFLVTGDSDQVPTVGLVREVSPAQRVVVLFPPERVSKHLKSVAHAALNINEASLRESQFPESVKLGSGVTIRRPDHWRS